MLKKLNILIILSLMISILLPASALAKSPQLPDDPVTITILHHNDFHGQLEPSGSNPGLARLSNTVNNVRTAVGEDNVLLMDVGDEMQGSLLSNIWQGEPVIAAYNLMGYDAATFGNHEFDWGQQVLISRTQEAAYPYVTANIVQNDTGDCATAGWTAPTFAEPYTLLTVGDPVPVTIGVIGVTTQETPYITIASATEGLCFKDPAESIIHYYDTMKTAGADVIVVLSHLGFNDGGYGYGFSVYGDKTLAARLNTAGKPVPLIMGGHSHTDLTAATMVGNTAVVQAHYNGRKVGRADLTINPDGTWGVVWTRLVIGTTDPQDPDVQDLINTYATDPDYLELINQEIGFTQVDLLRNYNGDAMMGNFVDDAIYGYLNNDAEPTNDVDMFFNNAGGIRIDWCDLEDPLNPGEYIWTSDPLLCQTEGLWTHDPMTLTYGMMFQILPFGNATIVGDMTGAQIIDLLNQSATLFKGAIQPSGIRYSFYRYSDLLPGPQPWAWGGFDAEVYNKDTATWEPLEMDRTYRVGTNEFLAPAGQDGYVQFKYMTNISYWGDMLDAVNAYVADNYTFANPYLGPDGDGTLDGRITRDGTDAGGSIIPITVLHHNDSHGNLVKGTYVGYTQLAAKITQERAHNPNRTLLVNTGDSFQGDAMMYFYKSAGLGVAADGTPLPPEMWINPLMKAFNVMDYDAMTLGNHEFNFGHQIFTSTLKAANFPVLQANVADDGQYGLAEVPVEPYVEKMVGPESVRVAILGIGNHRIPNYELPSNIPGLSFSNPLESAQGLSDQLRDTNDIVLALTHIGFTENPSSVEVDENIDTNLAATVSGIDLIIGGHSHTNPATGFGMYKFLPTFVGGPNNTPVLINHAYRYNNTLGEVVIGVRPNTTEGYGYDVVSRAGRYISIALADPEDPTIQALAAPYVALYQTYVNTEIGETTVPIDALQAYTQETNGANLQADAAVWELEDHNIFPDFHLSGAMSNRKVADAATPADPVMLKVNDMFTLMPYENSLVVMEMNGPQIKNVLERGYRNYYYYKYVPGYGGYSYYTTCMLTTDAGNVITYRDTFPSLPNGNNVASLVVGGQPIDFEDAGTYYNVSTVNYLAAGSCNFNDAGVTLWPLDQIVADSQLYVRDAVINYITAMGIVSPAIEGRLVFAPGPDLATSVKTVTDASGDGLAQLGEILTYSIQITNTGNMDASVWVTDTLPAGVDYVADSLVLPDIFTGTMANDMLKVHTTTDLEADSGVTILFQAEVVEGVPAGDLISNLIELEDQVMSYAIPAADIPMDVYYGAELTPAADAQSAAPGEVVTYTLQLENTGNVSDTFTIGFSGNLWDVHVVETNFVLDAGEEAAVVVHVTIPADALNGDLDMVTVEASSAGGATASSELTTTAEVVPVEPMARLAVGHLAPFAMDPGTAVSVTLNGTAVLTDFMFADSTAYLDIPAGITHTVEIFAAGVVTPAISAQINLMEGMDYTAIAVGGANGWPLELLALLDDNTAPAAGKFHLRLGHLAPFTDTLTGTLADIRLQDGTPVITDVPFGAVTAYIPLDAGTYDLKITTPGGAVTLIDPLPVIFAEGDIVSAFAVGDGVNQPLGVFAWPSDTVGFLLPLQGWTQVFLPLVPQAYETP